MWIKGFATGFAVDVDLGGPIQHDLATGRNFVFVERKMEQKIFKIQCISTNAPQIVRHLWYMRSTHRDRCNRSLSGISPGFQE